MLGHAHYYYRTTVVSVYCAYDGSGTVIVPEPIVLIDVGYGGVYAALAVRAVVVESVRWLSDHCLVVVLVCH